MAENKTPFKTNIDQELGPFKARKKRRVTRFFKPIKATRVDVEKEKTSRIKWVLKWVLLLPLSVYAFVWLTVLAVDLFKT